MQTALGAAGDFAKTHKVDANAIMGASGMERLKLICSAVESLVSPDGVRNEFLGLTAGVTKAYKAVLPDERAAPFLKVFGRPEGASVCECERVQSSSLAQSLHLMNSAEVKAKLAAAARAGGTSMMTAARSMIDTDELKPRARGALRSLVEDFDRWRAAGRIV